MANEIQPLEQRIVQEIERVEDPNRVFHNVYFYALRGLAHLDLLNQAYSVYKGGLTFDDFSAKYDPVPGKESGKPGLSLLPLKERGVFIHPDHFGEHINGRFTPFEGDLNNGLSYQEILLNREKRHDEAQRYREQLKDYRVGLQERGWKLEEFVDPKVIVSGIQFAKLLIKNQFDQYEDKIPRSGIYGDYQELTTSEVELGQRLVAHYKEAERDLTLKI